MTIIRNAPRTAGAKRLGESRPVAPEAEPAVVAPDRDAVLASLREAFADELEQLREESRQEGRRAAEVERQATLQKLEENYETQLKVDRAQQEARLAAECARLQALAAELQRQGPVLQSEAEAAALEIAFQTVTKLLGQHRAEKPWLADLVAQALKAHRVSGPVTVRIAADDFALLKGGEDAGMAIEFTADPALKPGDCLIGFGEGRVDASLAKQLDRIRDIFLESLAARHENA
jgi:flagellar biosynthesis/type III secretory pathway protein FliH